MEKIIALLNKFRPMCQRFRRYLSTKMLVVATNRMLYAQKSRFASVTLTPEQEAEIQSLWKTHYGREINLDWHRFYQSYLHNSVGGGYDKHYFPDTIYGAELLPVLNPNRRVHVCGDKGMEEYFLHNACVTVPETLLLSGSGYFYNGRREVIAEEDAARILTSCGKIVVKPTHSCAGKGVHFYDCSDGSADGLSGESLLKTIRGIQHTDFIVQRQIEQHETLARINAPSTNSFRITTYILEGKVYVTPIFLRVGQGANRVDNLSAGGICIGISEEGLLDKVGFTKKQAAYYQHPDSGVVFEGYRIPKTREIIAAAKTLHGRITHVGIIGWDMTLDANGDVVVVEYNIEHPALPIVQYQGRSAFGENTPKMIALCRKKSLPKARR
jgi:hypothetical protein